MSITLEICHGEASRRRVFRAELDDETVAWLCELADVCHAQPAVIATSILRNVREDDQSAHGEAPPEVITLQ
jgi:hypothetical protein